MKITMLPLNENAYNVLVLDLVNATMQVCKDNAPVEGVENGLVLMLRLPELSAEEAGNLVEQALPLAEEILNGFRIVTIKKTTEEPVFFDLYATVEEKQGQFSSSAWNARGQLENLCAKVFHDHGFNAPACLYIYS